MPRRQSEGSQVSIPVDWRLGDLEGVTMGFLAEANEQKAAAALARAVEIGEVSFLCLRCDRTSTDPEGAASSLCPACRKWIAGARLYPVGFIWGVAIASGPFIAGGLAVLNWWRIGDRQKMTKVGLPLGGAGLGLLFFGPLVFLPPIPCVGLIWLGVTAALIAYATAGLGPMLTAHAATGGRRGNLVVPILIALVLAAPGGWIWIVGMKKFFGG